MNRNLPLFLFFLGTIGSLQAAPSIRMPKMPEGLTADKKPAQVSKLAVKKKTPQKRDGKSRKGLTHLKIKNTYSNMTYDELTIAKQRCIDARNFEIAAKYLERMIVLCEDVHEKATLIIELADIFYNQKEFDKAKKWYQDFEQLYPGNKLIEKARRNIILCTKERILSPDRDQTPTEETLKLATEYLAKDSYQTYRDEVSKIRKECEAILAQSDCNVAEFYIKRGDYSSAEKRVKHIRTAWLDKVPEVGITLAQLEVNLGKEWKEFKVPEESFKLAQATAQVKPQRKVDMTARF